MNLIEVAKKFGTPEACNDLLEQLRWPEGVECTREGCGSKRVSRFVQKASTRERFSKKSGQMETKAVPARILYVCLKCKKKFSVGEGTIFNDTHLSLETWFHAVALMCNARKGLSAAQMERDLDVKTYKTAWYLCHRVREAMVAEGIEVMDGTVEADCTFIGGRLDKRRKRKAYQKQPVFGLLQRGENGQHSRVYVQPILKETRPVTRPIIEARVAKDAMLYTDEHGAYRSIPTRRHEIVIHSKGEYVRDDCTTNGVEGFWSLVKRQIIGQHHFVSVKHLSRYLNEVSFKFNNRDCESLFMLVLIRLLMGAPLQYAALTADPEESAPTVAADDEPF